MRSSPHTVTGMSKRFLSDNVLEAAQKRIAWTFDMFPRVYVSFSAGKDSTVMLHLVAAEARKRRLTFGCLLVDLEGQYKLTIEHAVQCFAEYADVIDCAAWVALPIALRNAVSVYEPKWLCWDPEKRDAWIRTPPDFAITDPAEFPFFQSGMEFEEFVPEFGEWYAQGQLTGCFVGIRSDESLNRFRTMVSVRKRKYGDKFFTSLVTPNVYNVYPIYDWSVEDIWTWHARNPDASYNRLYDMMAKAGLTLSQMRICQPYGDDQRRGLWLFHLIEPETWARVVSRVNGANGGALYVREWGNINGYRKITKPPQHTWKSFAALLVGSMPPAMSARYRDKILLFEKWWSERGYPTGIPDEADYTMEAQRMAPSWRRVCKSLLRNDYWCKGLGFSQHISDAYDRYQSVMKKRRQRWNVADNNLGLFADPALGTDTGLEK
jgi:predicted phosphoadenosine phosphosulfate sulfurtransferase